jgi:hypothetical protein
MQITETEILIPLKVPANSRLRQLSINHKGILCGLPIFSTLITWDEMIAMVPYTWKLFGYTYPVLGIIPRDYKSLITRAIEEHTEHAWQRAWYHFLDKINAWFEHGSNARAPIHIFELRLPLSIDELLVVMQERFTVELREHHVMIQGWQNEAASDIS